MKRILFLALALTACNRTPGPTVYRDVPVEVKVPVAQPCVVGVRPAPPLALNKQYSADQWKALDPRQKAAIVSRHALDLRTYGENVHGATASCN